MSGSDDPEHQSVHELFDFLLDNRVPAEIILVDMVYSEIEYVTRRNAKSKEDCKERLKQLEQAKNSVKVFIERPRLDEEVLKQHVRKDGDFQDAVILGQLANSIAEYFVSSDAAFRKIGSWKNVKQVLKPGSAVKTLTVQLPDIDEKPNNE